MNLEFGNELHTEDRNLRVVGMQMVFKAMRLDEVTK